MAKKAKTVKKAAGKTPSRKKRAVAKTAERAIASSDAALEDLSRSGRSAGPARRGACDPWPHGPRVKHINLALQGGGAHGAFTWGVLDRLLQDDGIAIDGISGTSAGAVNGAVMAYGLTVGGRETARELLAQLWEKVAAIAALSPLQPTPLDRALGLGRMDFSPGYWLLDTLSRVLSPYQFNAFNLNPLKSVLAEIVDFEALRACDTIKLFVGATDVKRSRIKIFELPDMSLEAVLASACLPFLNQAIEIDGEAYWDGGYMGNPAIFPLIYSTDCRDVLLVQINPINDDSVPRGAQEIIDRLNSITFNSTLMREMRAIAFVTKLIDQGFDDGGRLKRLLIHMIGAEEVMRELGVSSKLNADWAFLKHLHDIGRDRADAWLAAHRKDLGKRTTIDIEELFL